MQEISTEIQLACSAEAAWKAISNIDGWADWSPIINASKGQLSLGEKLDITMCGPQEGKDGPRYKPKVIELEDGVRFRWRAHMIAGFLFTNEKLIELHPQGNGCKLVHKELFSGILAPVFCGQMEKGVPPMLNKMNEALKKKLESAKSA